MTSPKEFIELMKKDDESVCHYLSKEQREGAKEVVEKGLDLIGKKVGEVYEEITPEAIKVITTLEGFLSVFIEHASNIPKIKQLIKEGQIG